MSWQASAHGWSALPPNQWVRIHSVARPVVSAVAPMSGRSKRPRRIGATPRLPRRSRAATPRRSVPPRPGPRRPPPVPVDRQSDGARRPSPPAPAAGSSDDRGGHPDLHGHVVRQQDPHEPGEQGHAPGREPSNEVDEQDRGGGIHRRHEEDRRGRVATERAEQQGEHDGCTRAEPPRARRRPPAMRRQSGRCESAYQSSRTYPAPRHRKKAAKTHTGIAAISSSARGHAHVPCPQALTIGRPLRGAPGMADHEPDALLHRGDRRTDGVLMPEPPSPVAPVGLTTLFFPAWNEEETSNAWWQRRQEAGQTLIATGRDRATTSSSSTTPRPTAPVIADKLAGGSRVRVVHHPRTASSAAASRPGSADAPGDLVLYTDADLPFDMAEVSKAVPAAAHLRGRHRQRLPFRPHRRGPPPPALLLRLQPPGPVVLGLAPARHELRLQAVACAMCSIMSS